MAVATGRVLVLPPSQKMYLLGTQSIQFGDFFPLEKMAREHAGLEIISMKQFLEETHGQVREIDGGKVALPPNGRTDWDGDTKSVRMFLNPWLQSIAPNPDWNPDRCIAAFPKSTDPEDSAELKRIFDELQAKLPPVEDFINHPTPVNETTEERMREFVAQRKELCLYTPALQNAQIIHFNGKKDLGGRLLVHFYAFLFFQDFKADLWMKRFVRDHVHYVEDVQCAAGKCAQRDLNLSLTNHTLKSTLTSDQSQNISSCPRSRSPALQGDGKRWSLRRFSYPAWRFSVQEDSSGCRRDFGRSQGSNPKRSNCVYWDR